MTLLYISNHHKEDPELKQLLTGTDFPFEREGGGNEDVFAITSTGGPHEHLPPETLQTAKARLLAIGIDVDKT